MAEFRLITREGDERAVQIEDGLSVMELVRNAGVDELLALCGGCLSCATCHVFVEGSDASRLLIRSEDENDLLETSDNRQSNSRLSCQLLLNDDVVDITIRIAPEE